MIAKISIYKGNNRHRISRALFLCMLLVSSYSHVFAELISITVVVENEGGGKLAGVRVTNLTTGQLLGRTERNGSLFIKDIEDTNELEFLYNEEFNVVSEKINKRKSFTVKLPRKSIESGTTVNLANIEILGERIDIEDLEEALIEDSEMEISGDSIYVSPPVTINDKLLGPRRRFIMQPVLRNLTRNTEAFYPPFVFDGKEYNITQSRMHQFEPNKRDTLDRFVKVKSTPAGTHDRFTYRNYIVVENPKDMYETWVKQVIIAYDGIKVVNMRRISRGTTYPLRFLEYSVAAADITDEQYFPTPIPQEKSDKEEINLSFLVGQSKLDPNDENNRIEMDKVKEKLAAIYNDRYSTLKSFYLSGIASPEGDYEKNINLARSRMLMAETEIKKYIPANQLSKVKFKTESTVATWEQVAILLEKDSRMEEAAALRKVVDRFPRDRNAQWRAALQLPFYKLLTTDYLPRLRRVTYEFSYTSFRVLTADEAWDIYNTNYKNLVKYDFFTLFGKEMSEEDREVLLKRALEVNPDDFFMANALAAQLIRQGKSDPSILESFINPDRPIELLQNQVVALLERFRYSQADSIASMMPETEETRVIKAVAMALGGNSKKAFDVLSKTSPLNEVVLLLQLKRNSEAYEKAQLLSEDTGEKLFVKAIAAARLKNEPGDIEAMSYLEKAFSLKPELEIIASGDGDVINVYEKYLEEQKYRTESEEDFGLDEN